MAGALTRKVYVGLSKVDFADEDLSVAPSDAVAAATIPDEAAVVGWRLVNGNEYVVWVCDV